MADQPRLEIIKDNPVRNGLDAFRTSFNVVYVQGLASSLLSTLQLLPVARLLPSNIGGGTLRSDLSKLNSAVNSDDFDLDRIKPLLTAALADHLDDVLIWERVYDAVTKSTPPPRPIASSLQQTPLLRNTGSFANSSEHRKYVDNVLKEELGPMYVDLRDFHKAYFGSLPNLATASKTFFDDCFEGTSPLFDGGWKKWPEGPKQDDVLGWFADFSDELAAFAKRHESAPTCRRRLLAKPDKLIAGSVAKRKMDIGFASAEKDSGCSWAQILVPGELKSNPSADIPSEAWLDLGRYAREVLAAQDTRRFVLGFTLCGSLMRVWVFDRLGGIASEQFDINKDGLRFVSTILGFLWMSEEELGFDPTIMTAKGQRFIEIERDGTTERLVLDSVMKRARCIAGRATTCWKAHREGDMDAPIVVKDSWQYLERDDEGGLLREATGKGVVRVARYYHHETVRVQNADDDVQGNVRKGLDVTKATKYQEDRSRLPSTIGLSKRHCSASPTKAGSSVLPNRVHRRVILSDYGIPIYKAGSRQALLGALADCIEGHESLRQKAGLLHRDISIGNLMVGKDNRGFLIDLDLAIKEQRIAASGAKGKTGTRAFMAIGALLGEQHSFMHDLESFFWVLFWICIHCDGPGDGKVVAQFDTWNYADLAELAKLKLGTVSDADIFRKTTEEFFTKYHRPLIPW
ncbi:dual serine/threonine and tyrosine protein kinase, partial [Staphylotrichum tortipilum]